MDTAPTPCLRRPNPMGSSAASTGSARAAGAAAAPCCAASSCCRSAAAALPATSAPWGIARQAASARCAGRHAPLPHSWRLAGLYLHTAWAGSKQAPSFVCLLNFLLQYPPPSFPSSPQPLPPPTPPLSLPGPARRQVLRRPLRLRQPALFGWSLRALRRKLPLLRDARHPHLPAGHGHLRGEAMGSSFLWGQRAPTPGALRAAPPRQLLKALLALPGVRSHMPCKCHWHEQGGVSSMISPRGRAA